LQSIRVNGVETEARAEAIMAVLAIAAEAGETDERADPRLRRAACVD
jgi:hypothetical protein